MTIQRSIIYLILLTCYSTQLLSQKAVVSEYYNETGSTANEWTELLVIEDNSSLVGCMLRDNAGSSGAPDKWQGGIRFKDDPLWKSLRSGTIILIKHRGSSAVDADKKDGYIEINAENSTFFEKVCWACTIDDWTYSALSIAQNNDIIQLIDPNENHIHCLSHISNLAKQGDYASLPPPKICRNCTVRDKASISVVPGLSISDYNTGIDNTHTSESTTYVSPGLPNNSDNSKDENQLFWRKLRQPQWLAPSLSIVSDHKGIKLNWNKSEDTNPNDETQGYLIVKFLKSDIPLASHPIDGMVYSVGSKIGNAVEVVEIIPSSNLNSFIDYSEARCGTEIVYRVYAFRYGKDKQGKDSRPINARGRAYNETNFAEAETVKLAPPKPTILTENNVSQICEGSSIKLSSSIINNISSFEWFWNGASEAISKQADIDAYKAGNYTLKISFQNGCNAISDTFHLRLIEMPQATIMLQKAESPNISINSDTTIYKTEKESITLSGNDKYQVHWFKDGNEIYSGAFLKVVSSGIYYNITKNENFCVDTSFKVEVIQSDAVFDIEPDTLYFALHSNETSGEKPSQLINKSNEWLSFGSDDIEQGEVFRLTMPQLPLSAPPLDAITVKAGFFPNKSGNYIDSIVFISGGYLSKTLYMIGSKEASRLNSNLSILDFGELLNCDTIGKDSSISVFNDGSDTILIMKPIFKADVAVRIINTSFPLVLAPNSHISMELNIAPLTETENYVDELLIPYSVLGIIDTISISIKGSFHSPDYDLLPKNEIDFGQLLECESKQDTVITFYNNGFVDLMLDLSKGNENIEIKNLPVTIPRRDSIKIPISFIPVNRGNFDFPIIFALEPCSLKDTIYIKGRKTGIEYSFDKTMLDFGQNIYCGSVKSVSKVLNLNINGDTSQNVYIKSFHFKNSNPSFSTDITAGQELKFGENTPSIEMLYMGDGEYIDTLFFMFSPCDIEMELPLQGSWFAPKFYLSNDTLDFGSGIVPYASNSKLRIENTGKTDIIINDLSLINSPFSFLGDKPQMPITILKKDSYELLFQYNQNEISNDTIVVSFIISEPCDTTVDIVFLGSATDNSKQVDLTLKIPDAIATVGEEFNLPIIAESRDWDMSKAFINKINLIIGYNPDLLFPINVEKNGSLAGATLQDALFAESPPGKLNISMNIDYPEMLTNGELFSIRFLALLGPSLNTNVSITGAHFSSVYDINIIPNNGEVTLEGNCNLENRLIQINKPLELKVLYPSHKNEIIFDITIVAKDMATLAIFNNLGAENCVLLNNTLAPGKYQINYGISNLSSGLYFAVFRNGISTKYVQFIVDK